MESDQQNSNGQIYAEDIDAEVLPLIYDLLRGIEKESADSTQKTPQDTSLKVLELHKKLNILREQIKKLPGIEYNREDQLKQFENLKKQSRLKRELLIKYRTTYSFDLPK